MHLTELEERMINAVNQWRAERTLFPLRVDFQLVEEARRSVRYARHQIRGKWVWERMARLGFQGHCTDNVARGQLTPEEAVECWGDEGPTSVGHNKQMRGLMKINDEWVDRQFNLIGAAIDDQKYLVIFGRRTD